MRFPPEPFGSSSAFVEALGQLSRRITEMNQFTEDRFTSLGMEIQEFSETASMITGSALKASSIISGDDLKSAIDGLEGMVDQLEDIFSRVDSFSSSNLEILGSIRQTVKSVEKELKGLGDTSKDLKMLALSTKIQSTRTGGGSSAFMQLGVDIAKMSVVISANAGDLHKKTHVLSEFTRNVEASLNELREKQRYQTQTVLKWTRSIIASMSDLNAKSKREAERIRHCIEEISRGVSEMVTSVQYQDITKQSFEKVIEGLERLGEIKIPDIQPEEGASAPLSVVSPELDLTGQLLKQINRLENTDDQVHQALRAMGGNLETISSSIGKMAGVTNVVNRDSSKFLGNLETAMSSVTTFLKGVVQSNQEMVESMNSLGQTAEGMSQFTNDIEMISSEVELISLNARIMAAQAGTDGAGMGVIADAVKATAAQSELQRSTVVAGLNEIYRTSVCLKEEMKNATRSDENNLDQLVRELGVFLDALRVMQSKIVSMLSDIDSRSAELTSAIRSSVDSISDLPSLKKEYEGIAEKMKDLALESADHILPTDLLAAAGSEVSEVDINNMKNHERLELVEAFFKEYSPDDYGMDQCAGIAEEEEVVLFDNLL